jgi:hypothetical protein
MGIVTLTFYQWPWIRVIKLPLVQCNNSLKYYSNPCISANLWSGQCLNHYEHSDLDLWTITLNKGHGTSLGPGQQSCEILFKFIKRVRCYGPDKLFAYVLTTMCIVTLTYKIRSRSWHFPRSRATIVLNIVQIYKEDQELWLGQTRPDNAIT